MQKHSENKSLNDLIARAKNERGPSLADLAEKEMCVACGDRFVSENDGFAQTQGICDHCMADLAELNKKFEV